MPSNRCLSCLSVTLVYCGQTAVWIKMKLGMEVALGHSYIVLDGDPASPKGHNPQFSAYARCGQTAERIKMPLGTEVGLGPSDIVLDGDQAPLSINGGTAALPQFSAHVLWLNGRMDQDAT